MESDLSGFKANWSLLISNNANLEKMSKSFDLHITFISIIITYLSGYKGGNKVMCIRHFRTGQYTAGHQQNIHMGVSTVIRGIVHQRETNMKKSSWVSFLRWVLTSWPARSAGRFIDRSTSATWYDSFFLGICEALSQICNSLKATVCNFGVLIAVLISPIWFFFRLYLIIYLVI